MTIIDPTHDTTTVSQVSLANRTIPTYDPAADFAERWPEWRMEVTNLHGPGELILITERLALIDAATYDRDPKFAEAHVLVHLDYHLKQLTARIARHLDMEADQLADLRLGRTGAWFA